MKRRLGILAVASTGRWGADRMGGLRTALRRRAGRLASGAMLAGLLAAGCASGPPPPDWQSNAKAATDRSIAAYLAGQPRVADAELDRARREVARTGRADLAARVELSRCAAQVASLVLGPCTAFEPLRVDAGPAERAYADYLSGRSTPADAALLPEPHRGAAPASIADPLARLIATGVAFQAGRGDPAIIASAVDTASAQGWRRPLLAWLGVALQRAESGGATDEAQRLKRRIARVEGDRGGAAAPTSP